MKHSKKKTSSNRVFFFLLFVSVFALGGVLYLVQQTQILNQFAAGHKQQNGENQNDSLRPKFSLNSEDQLTPRMCHATGDPIISIRERIVHDVDSGQAGNNWAFDTINRQIQVWNVGLNNYCGIIKDDADFQGVAGETSPGQTTLKATSLTGDEHGEFRGGYRTTVFSGTLYVADQTNWPLHGEVKPNPVDYGCNIQGTCPGYINWTSKYFTNISGFDLAWWGWIYFGGDSGTWVNAITGNFGDILDVDPAHKHPDSDNSQPQHHPKDNNDIHHPDK